MLLRRLRVGSASPLQFQLGWSEGPAGRAVDGVEVMPRSPIRVKKKGCQPYNEHLSARTVRVGKRSQARKAISHHGRVDGMNGGYGEILS